MIDNSVAKNSTANLITRMWGIVSIYLFIPLYIRFLGEEAYGLVSFFATLQATMNLLGLGLSGTLRREFATGNNDDKNRIYKYRMLKSVEIVYSLIALFIALITFLGSDYISESWLNLISLNASTVSVTISLMGISIGIQLLTNLYHGCLLGLNRQVLVNVYYLSWAVCKSVGSIFSIVLIAPNLIYLYSWHIICDLAYFVILRLKIGSILKRNIKVNWELKDLRNLKSIWKYSIGLLSISIISVITRQLDKAVISKFLLLTELGAYNLAVTLGQMSTIVSSALSITLFTNFTQLFSLNKNNELKAYFIKYNNILSIIILCMGSFIAIFSSDLMLFWTNNVSIVDIIGNTAVFVVLGTTFLSLQELPYSFVLAHGNTKINNFMGIISLPFLIIFPYLAIVNFGLVGAGISYVMLMFLQTFIYIAIIYKKYIGTNVLKWLFSNYFMPFAISMTSALISKRIAEFITNSLYQKVAFVIISGAITLILIFITMHRETVKKVFWAVIDKDANTKS